jgi:hypothetical protein
VQVPPILSTIAFVPSANSDTVRKKNIFLKSICFFFLWQYWDLNYILVIVRQMLYHMSRGPSPTNKYVNENIFSFVDAQMILRVSRVS